MHITDPDARLRHALAGYARRWPGEAGEVARFVELLDQAGAEGGGEAGTDPFTRERLAGHFTGSAWLVDRGGTRALLTHHRKLDRWLQPGGHADGDRDPVRVALREAREESGLTALQVDAELFDLDRHWIPGRGEVPGHWHYDLRYVVRAGDDEAYVVGDESHDLAWRDIRAIADGAGADGSLRRMARKWLQSL